MRSREELSGRSPIAPGQARLTSELFADGLSEKKLQLIDMSILLILLSPGPGCYILTPLRDRRLLTYVVNIQTDKTNFTNSSYMLKEH